MNQIYRHHYLLSFLLLLLSFNSYGQQKENYTIRIDSLIETATVRPFNGVVLVTQKGKAKYSKAYGYSNFEKRTPLKTTDNFVILSNSKQITAVLVLQEVDKGQIDLHTNIKKYLPDLKQTWADSVTVHNLLNHTSGIIGLDKLLAFKTGTQFKYSDLNYILLGKVIEFTSKKTYEEKANELFRKCGMKNTFSPNATNQYQVINGYEYLTNNTKKEIIGVIIPKQMVPAAGIVTTANDLSIWNNKLHNDDLLKPETYELMTSYSIKAQHSVFGKSDIGYGYGIRINDLESAKEFGHTGIVPSQGFTSLNLYYPATKTSVIILENQAFDDLDISYYFEIAIRKIIKESNLTIKN